MIETVAAEDIQSGKELTPDARNDILSNVLIPLRREDTTRLTSTKLISIIIAISYDSTVNVQKKRSKDITEKT